MFQSGCFIGNSTHGASQRFRCVGNIANSTHGASQYFRVGDS